MAQSAIGAPLAPSGVSGSPAAMPISSVLGQHRTLNLASGFQGSLDGRGRKMVGGSDEPPRVSLLPGDERWADWFGQPGVNAAVHAVAADAAGNVYVGGEFTEAGGASANRIAKWNGMGWSALGAGLDGTVRALAVDGSGNVYAGGDFTNAGGVFVDHVAMWNGSSWSPLGSGLDGEVLALAVDTSGNLYAGGNFGSSGDVAVNSIAKWNGITWSALGSGVFGAVNVLAIDSRTGDLYAGGNFTTAGGVAANRIAKWNGSTWSAVGSGVNNSVYALAIQPGSERSRYLWVGGDFTAAGDKPSYYIARWDIFTKVFVPLVMKSYAGGW